VLWWIALADLALTLKKVHWNVTGDWDGYSIGRADDIEHLAALDVVFAGIIEGHRHAIETTEDTAVSWREQGEVGQDRQRRSRQFAEQSLGQMRP
jgi:hypothetical protein